MTGPKGCKMRCFATKRAPCLPMTLLNACLSERGGLYGHDTQSHVYIDVEYGNTRYSFWFERYKTTIRIKSRSQKEQ